MNMIIRKNDPRRWTRNIKVIYIYEDKHLIKQVSFLAVEYDDDDDDDDSDDDDSSDGFDNNDIEWKPKKKSRYLDDSDDVSTDSSDKELTKQEAERFLNSSTSKHHGHVVKKPRSEDDE
jgi:hypothetical protein